MRNRKTGSCCGDAAEKEQAGAPLCLPRRRRVVPAVGGHHCTPGAWKERSESRHAGRATECFGCHQSQRTAKCELEHRLGLAELDWLCPSQPADVELCQETLGPARAFRGQPLIDSGACHRAYRMRVVEFAARAAFKHTAEAIYQWF